MGLLSHFSRPVAITILPLAGFVFEASLQDPVMPTSALHATYAVCLVAFGALWAGAERWSPIAASIAAGILGVGSLVAGLVAAFGTLAACFMLFVGTIFPGNLLSAIFSALVFVSPWLTSKALLESAVHSLRESRERLGWVLTVSCAIVGMGLTLGFMGMAVRGEAAWLAPRLEVFDGDDINAWERSLSDIKARPLCGHRRCLMGVCFKLMERFGKTDGVSGPFASPFGFALEAPNVPEHLAASFEKVYGYPVHQVCVVGD
jgi:hypothetical protein